MAKTRKNQKLDKAIAYDTYLAYQPTKRVREVLVKPRGSTLPLGVGVFGDVATRARVHSDTALAVVEWFMQNPQQQGCIDDSWLAYIKQDFRMTLWDVLSRSSLVLPDLNVYPKVKSTYVFWRDGASFRDVHQYLAQSSVKLAGMRDAFTDVTQDIGDFVAAGGQRVTLRRVLSPVQFLNQASPRSNEPMQRWDPSALRPGDSFVSTS